MPLCLCPGVEVLSCSYVIRLFCFFLTPFIYSLFPSTVVFNVHFLCLWIYADVIGQEVFSVTVSMRLACKGSLSQIQGSETAGRPTSPWADDCRGSSRDAYFHTFPAAQRRAPPFSERRSARADWLHHFRFGKAPLWREENLCVWLWQLSLACRIRRGVIL